MLFQATKNRNLGSRVVSSLGRITLGAALLVTAAAGQQAPRLRVRYIFRLELSRIGAETLTG